MGAFALTLAVLASSAMAISAPLEWAGEAHAGLRISRFALSLLPWFALIGMPRIARAPGDRFDRASSAVGDRGDAAPTSGGRALGPLAWMLPPCALALGLDLADDFDRSALLETALVALLLVAFLSFAAERARTSWFYAVAWFCALPLPVALSSLLPLGRADALQNLGAASPLGWLIERCSEAPQTGWTTELLVASGSWRNPFDVSGLVPLGVGAALFVIATTTRPEPAQREFEPGEAASGSES